MAKAAQRKKRGRGGVKTVAVFFGGRSAEHEISITSARCVLENIDRSRFSPVAVFVDPQGVWKKADLRAVVRSGAVPSENSQPLFPVPGKGVLCEIKNGALSRRKIDAAFPVLHGTDGEDGAMQGLFEIWGVPYAGARVLGSAAASDKLTAKRLLQNASLPVVPFSGLKKSDWEKSGARAATASARKTGFPCFVKPSNLGSSIGIFKISAPGQVTAAVRKSFEFSDTVIFETAVPEAREIEVSVLGLDEPRASVPGEIVPEGDFYDYAAKYGGGQSRLLVPAPLPADLKKRIRAAALDAFSALSCSAMARVDFLLNPQTGEFFVSELNTIPGFTQISMYPKLWEASGVSCRDLISALIDFAFESEERKKSLKTEYPGGGAISP